MREVSPRQLEGVLHEILADLEGARPDQFDLETRAALHAWIVGPERRPWLPVADVWAIAQWWGHHLHGWPLDAAPESARTH